jgi:hypothetical protein
LFKQRPLWVLSLDGGVFKNGLIASALSSNKRLRAFWFAVRCSTYVHTPPRRHGSQPIASPSFHSRRHPQPSDRPDRVPEIGVSGGGILLLVFASLEYGSKPEAKVGR